MRRLTTIVLLLATILSYGQTVTIPVRTLPVTGLEAYQTKADAKKQVDSLAAVLRSEFANSTPGVPAEPVQPDCEVGIDLVSVYDVTMADLWYNYYSVGVKRLIAVIYNSSGREVERYTTEDVTSDRIYVPYNLSPGNYTLVVQNADCKAVSQAKPFIVPGGAPSEPIPEPAPEQPSGPATGFYNPGVYQAQIGSVLYEWIPTENTSVEVANGKVRIVAPETKKSWNGQNNCKRFVLGDLYDNKLSDSDERALFGEGLTLPAGQYTFKILYFNASTWEQVRGESCKYFAYSHPCGQADSQSARAEIVTISVTEQGRIQGLDANLFRASWIPQYQLLPYSLSLPENKAFGTTRYIASVPHDSLLSKVSHIQYIYSWVDGINKNRAWRNMQALGSDGSWRTHGRIDKDGNRIPDNIAEPQWHIDRAIINKGYILMSEYAENYGNHRGCPPCYDKVEETFKGIYARFQSEQGVTSPEQTWLGADYFAPLHSGSLSLSFSESIATLSEGMSSVSFSQKRRYNDAWDGVGYFTRGRINYRNYFSQGYLPHLWGQAGKPAFYERLYNHEKANLAIPNRKKITYSRIAQEGLHEDKITISGVWYRTKFNEGELLRADEIGHSFNTMLSDAFYALLLGDAYIIWDSNVRMNTDPYTFHPSWFGGHDDNKTRWKPNGGGAYTYKPGTNGPPQIEAEGQFPEKPLIGDQGAWVGAKMYESVTGRVDQLWYPDYSVNGKSVVAKRGSKGQELSYRGVQNEGQDNLVKTYEANLPVVMKGRGSDGEVIIYQNPNAGLTEEQGVEVEGKFFKITGNKLNVIKL